MITRKGEQDRLKSSLLVFEPDLNKGLFKSVELGWEIFLSADLKNKRHR